MFQLLQIQIAVGVNSLYGKYSWVSVSLLVYIYWSSLIIYSPWFCSWCVKAFRVDDAITRVERAPGKQSKPFFLFESVYNQSTMFTTKVAVFVFFHSQRDSQNLVTYTV